MPANIVAGCHQPAIGTVRQSLLKTEWLEQACAGAYVVEPFLEVSSCIFGGFDVRHRPPFKFKDYGLLSVSLDLIPRVDAEPGFMAALIPRTGVVQVLWSRVVVITEALARVPSFTRARRGPHAPPPTEGDLGTVGSAHADVTTYGLPSEAFRRPAKSAV